MCGVCTRMLLDCELRACTCACVSACVECVGMFIRHYGCEFTWRRVMRVWSPQDPGALKFSSPLREWHS